MILGHDMGVFLCPVRLGMLRPMGVEEGGSRRVPKPLEDAE